MNLLWNNPVLTAAAMIPAIFLMVKIYQADKLEKEPMGLLISLVLIGVLATVFAGLAEALGDAVIGFFFLEDSIIYCLLFYFGVVATAEEGAKYILLKKCSWKTPAFDYQFDGIVYAVFVSLGFALWENVGYVFAYGLEVALLRALTAIPGHACFGVFMGAWYGLAKRYDLQGNEAKSSFYRKLAFGMPVMAHGTYDFLASVDIGLAAIGFYIFLIAMFVTAFRFVKRLSAKDRRIANDEYDGFYE